jgi:hypothetical protein
MGKSKKGLNTKVVTIYDPNSSNEAEVYVSYSWFNEPDMGDDTYGDLFYVNREDIDIKHFESNNDEELPDWVSEDLVYESLIEELEDEHSDDEDDFEEEDEFKDDFGNDDDENW